MKIKVGVNSLIFDMFANTTKLELNFILTVKSC